ncbi:hypothetical protein ACFFNY_16895 [Paenibacillus hodogayensis]|uniref:Uncharacterized protein n=1 Tax=Paenibacillus hodogayensis TaxID=279208 RepID=A0ABV5VZ44_9BACL
MIFALLVITTITWLPAHSLIKVPFSENRYVMKTVNAQLVTRENELFEMYVEQMREKGYAYVQEERMGALCAFEKNGEIH